MSRLDKISPEFESLLSAACCEDAAPEDLRALEQAADDPASMGLVVDYLQLNTDLQWLILRQSNADKCLDMLDIGPAINSPSPFEEVLETQEPPLAVVRLPLSSPPSPLSPTFVGGPVFSYMVATVILGMLLLGGWIYKVTHVQTTLHQAAKIHHNTTSPPRIFVGQITDMRNCHWADPQTEIYLGSSVPLERRFALSSGLLEITYKSGAKVILEGPCDYQVESHVGGYLKRGKLTARVEQKAGRVKNIVSGTGSGGDLPRAAFSGIQLSVSAALNSPGIFLPSSISPDFVTDVGLEVYIADFEMPIDQLLVDEFTKKAVHFSQSQNNSQKSLLSSNRPPLFSIRTPTATITDLGTEFGVEVNTGGETQVHVFNGTVEAEWYGSSGAAGQKVRLTTGQAAGFDSRQGTIASVPIQSQEFIRVIPAMAGQVSNVALKKTIIKWSGVYRYGDHAKGTSDWTTWDRFGVWHVNDGTTDEGEPGNAYWLGRERTPDEFFTIFLRGRYQVERIELVNTHNGPGNDRGTKDFEIWVADEIGQDNKLISPRLVLKGTLPCRFGAGADIPGDVFSADEGDFERFNARYVKFVAKTFYESKDFGGCGLNEIRLFATPAGTGKE